MQIIIVSPSLDPAKNVSGISSVAKFVTENNPCHQYIHFELGRKDDEKGGFHRIGSILQKFKEWRRLLRKHPEALVHYNFPMDKQSVIRDAPFMRAALRNGNKMIVHIHGGRFLTSDSISFPFRQILMHIFSWELPFIALSDNEASIISSRFHARDVFCLPNCIDLGDAKLFERSFDNDSNSILTLGYLGRIAKTKGMEYLLQACSQLKLRNIPFRLKVAGAEEINGDFIPLFHEMLGDQFDYCGIVSGERKCQFLRSLDLFVMPTFFEGLPMSLLECMSYGVVPVITPVGSIPTVVTNNMNGLFIKVQDTDSIVDAVASLSANRVRLMNISKNAREYVFAHCNPQSYFLNLNRIYNHTNTETSEGPSHEEI